MNPVAKNVSKKIGIAQIGKVIVKKAASIFFIA
jgi:hypothetical protein